MNPITDLVFTLSWFVLLIVAIRQMAKGWNAQSSTAGVWTTQVKKPVHPEMVDVKPGEELMGVTFKNQQDDSLLQSLQERIDEIEEDEEEEDDDGDIIVRV